MSQLKFTKTPAAAMDRNTIELRLETKGIVGELSSGNVKSGTVLKLKDNLYVTTDKSALKLKTMAAMDKADIHYIANRADMIFFLQRYTLFNRRG